MCYISNEKSLAFKNLKKIILSKLPVIRVISKYTLTYILSIKLGRTLRGYPQYDNFIMNECKLSTKKLYIHIII